MSKLIIIILKWIEFWIVPKYLKIKSNKFESAEMIKYGKRQRYLKKRTKKKIVINSLCWAPITLVSNIVMPSGLNKIADNRRVQASLYHLRLSSFGNPFINEIREGKDLVMLDLMMCISSIQKNRKKKKKRVKGNA